MDLEAESAAITVDTGKSKDIAKSCKELLDLQNEIATLEEQVKKKKEAETFLSEQTIPNLMQSAGIAMIKLGRWFFRGGQAFLRRENPCIQE
jgi:hypothetical protein